MTAIAPDTIQQESVKRGSVTTSLFNIAGRSIGFLSVFLISYLFGANHKTDIYYFLFSFTSLIAALVTSLQSAVTSPLFIKIKETEGKAQAWMFINSLLSYTVLVVVIISIPFALFSIQIMAVISRFPYQTLAENRILIILFAPVVVLMIVADFLRNTIQANSQFTFPASTVVTGNFMLVVILVALGSWMGETAMIISLLGSYVLQCLLLIFYLKKKEPLFEINWKITHSHRQFLKLVWPVLLTQLLGSGSMFYYDYSATVFTGGTLTAIAFAQKIFSLPYEMIVAPVANVMSPVFSRHSAKNDQSSLLKDYLKYNNLIWYILIPISVFLFFFSLPIVEMFYERGSFDQKDAATVSSSLKWFSVGLFGLSYNSISTRVFFSLQKTLWLSVSSVIISILSVLLTSFAVTKYGFIGIPLSRSASVVVFSLILGITFSHLYLEKFNIRQLLVPFLKFAGAAILTAFIVKEIYDLLLLQSPAGGNQGMVIRMVKLFITLLFFLIGYFLFTAVFRCVEVQVVKRTLHGLNFFFRKKDATRVD